jgi:hypothetical protein
VESIETGVNQPNWEPHIKARDLRKNCIKPAEITQNGGKGKNTSEIENCQKTSQKEVNLGSWC